MDAFIAWIVTLSLGLDALIVSASIGLREAPRDKWRIAFTFAAAESLMPIAGIVIGGALGRAFAGAVSVIGAVMLIGVAIYFLFFDRDDDEQEAFGSSLVGWPLLAAAIGVSLDELAVGLSAGLLQAPIVLTILLIAAQSFVFSTLGVTFGAKLKPCLGEFAEKASGLILGGMGVWMLLESLGAV
ncbi:manganese efflux pump MntP [Cohnella fermenti]|uniref:Manganese efflux pump MntP n=1 Tax=Cohnella fermenti TaxID=2565925 RepID=A0A4S4BET4_9BACL|nr:manganese efflux pump [Cohnella fermenti]THF72699.1 hypothetical protein E6C55_32150 [Cohnella fermenti]